MWLGLNDRLSEGWFIWSDGSQLDYNEWLLHQPDNDKYIYTCAYLKVSYTYFYVPPTKNMSQRPTLTQAWLDLDLNYLYTPLAVHCSPLLLLGEHLVTHQGGPETVIFQINLIPNFSTSCCPCVRPCVCPKILKA